MLPRRELLRCECYVDSHDSIILYVCNLQVPTKYLKIVKMWLTISFTKKSTLQASIQTVIYLIPPLFLLSYTHYPSKSQKAASTTHARFVNTCSPKNLPASVSRDLGDAVTGLPCFEFSSGDAFPNSFSGRCARGVFSIRFPSKREIQQIVRRLAKRYDSVRHRISRIEVKVVGECLVCGDLVTKTRYMSADAMRLLAGLVQSRMCLK